jgi:hypothetical protein
LHLGRINRKAKLGIVDPWPIEFGKEFGLVGIIGVDLLLTTFTI